MEREKKSKKQIENDPIHVYYTYVKNMINLSRVAQTSKKKLEVSSKLEASQTESL